MAEERFARAVFSTGQGAANRAVFLAEPANASDLVGLARRGPRRDADKATKGSPLHP